MNQSLPRPKHKPLNLKPAAKKKFESVNRKKGVKFLKM